MEDIEYYKTLVSDDEVISALVKDSKAREGLLEKTRVRPNLKFFQRTVTNLVSSNKRVTEKQEQVKAIEKEKNKVYRPQKVFVRKKLPIEYIREILSNKIDFVKSTEESQSPEVTNTNNTIEYQDKGEMSTYHNHQSIKQRRTLNQKKTPFQQIREILTKNVDKNNKSKLKEKDEESKDLKTNGFTDTIITLSDSDCSDSEKSEDNTNKNICFSNFRSRKKQNTLCN